MIYYRLTCLQDIPITNEPDVNVCEKGFSFTIADEWLNEKCYMTWISDKQLEGYDFHTRRDILSPKVEALRQFYKHPQFVKVEPDLNYAHKELRCPKCRCHALFTKYGETRKHYDGDVTKWFQSFGLECGLCDYTTNLGEICTKTKIDW